MREVFWLKFSNPPMGLGLGAGVTAHNEEDAARMLTDEFGDLTISEVNPINSMEDLEQDHVRPNMGSMLRRGIWYPNVTGTA